MPEGRKQDNMTENNNNTSRTLNDSERELISGALGIDVDDNAIVTDTRATAGMLIDTLSKYDRDAEVVIPIMIFGQQIDEYEVAAVVANDEGTILGIMASPKMEFTDEDLDAVMSGIVGDLLENDGDQAQEDKPFA